MPSQCFFLIFFFAKILFMKRNMCKFLIFFFIIGINIPFSSAIFNDLKSNSITYSYLCKLENNSESEKKIAKKKCLYCILENGSATDKNLSSCENIIDTFASYITFSFYTNFHNSLKFNFKKNRSPPFIS